MERQIQALKGRPRQRRPGKKEIMQAVRGHLQKVQDSVILDFVQKEVANISSPDRRIQRCIDAIRNAGADEKKAAAREQRRSKSQVHIRIQRNVCAMGNVKKEEEEKEKEQKTILPSVRGSSGYNSQRNGRGAYIRTLGEEEELKLRRAKLMYRYKFCKTLLNEIENTEQGLLDPHSNFDYYIWQTANRCGEGSLK